MAPGLLVRGVLASLLFAMVPSIDAMDLEAWIDTEMKDGALRATPKVRVQSPRTIRYELSAKKTGNAGSSSTHQAGTLAIACCDPVSLATLRLSIASADTYTLTLIVYVDDQIAARVEVPYPLAKDP